MRKGIRGTVKALFVFIAVSAFLVAGCTKYANEEQMQTLEETKNAALAAEEKVEDLEAKKSDLQEKLSEKQDELEKVKQEKKKVTSKL